jgi:iron complex transport system permease protein
VAFVTMAGGVGAVTEFGTVAAAAAGAIAVLLILLLVAHRFSDITSVLIVGLMLSFFTSAAVSILQAHADDSALKAFVFWGFGSFSQISFERLPLLVIPVLAVILISPVFIKPLNNLLPGELHAKSMGVRVGRLRLSLVLLTGIMVGTVTAFCGPIAFIGLAGPHIARFAFSTPNHRTILPASLVLGSVLALACDLISRLPGTDYALPLNTVCAFMGAPVVVYLIFKGRKKRIFT